MSSPLFNLPAIDTLVSSLATTTSIVSSLPSAFHSSRDMVHLAPLLSSPMTSLPSTIISLAPMAPAEAPEVAFVQTATSPPSFELLLQHIGLLPSLSLPPSMSCESLPVPSFTAALTASTDSLDIPSTSRRLSAPETPCMERRRDPEARRRFSDFSIEHLLHGRRRDECGLKGEEPRTASGRKQRTIYGLRQTEVLEEAFTSQQYMVGAERELLAARLGLSEAQVRVWFQNRRSKQRKQNRGALEAATRATSGNPPPP